jgi:hypothetical protein
MKPFHLDKDMKTLRGVFYPTGWMVLMFPGEQQAREAAQLLEGEHGVAGDEILLVTPQDFRQEILGAAGDDVALPSAGSEGDTVRRFAELAAKGHHALMIRAPHGADADRVMAALEGLPISYGQKYRTLVIEDIVT